MTFNDINKVRPRGSWIKFLLFPLALLLLTAVQAHAQSVNCPSPTTGAVIDGFVNPIPPSQISIKGNCTIQNFPASNPLTSNIHRQHLLRQAAGECDLVRQRLHHDCPTRLSESLYSCRED